MYAQYTLHSFCAEDRSSSAGINPPRHRLSALSSSLSYAYIQAITGIIFVPIRRNYKIIRIAFAAAGRVDFFAHGFQAAFQKVKLPFWYDYLTGSAKQLLIFKQIQS
jgi:hypothetical protein